MAYNPIENSWMLTPEMEKLIKEKKAGVELQERRHVDWDDNYTLYRNKVKTNRLTQRQAVNIPLMKETVKTLLSRIDEPPVVDWVEKGGDEQKEIYYQEIWNYQTIKNKLEVIDVLDKKNVLLYGLSTKKLNIDENGVSVSVLDPYDAVFDPLMNPWDIESARFIIHQNIFRTVREILADDRYTEEGKKEIKIWADSSPGITQGTLNKEQWEKKMERAKAMGVEHGDFPFYAGGDRIIGLTEHYTKVWNTKTKAFEKRVIVYADDKIELLNEKLIDLIGVDFWPFVVWSEDPETNDIYPDSVADLVRTPNKVLNIWFSQLIENRTLKNFQMHWYDATQQGYSPQTYTPGPGVMLPAPGDPNKTILPVNISGLDDTLQAISAVTQIVERGTGATAIEKGQAEKGVQTLGEVQILVGKANERTLGMAKFYRLAWQELAVKWDKLMHANAPKVVNLFKTSSSGQAYPMVLYKSDWKSDVGYEPIVRSSSEQEEESMKGIQKFMFILAQFPQNPVLKRIAQKRMLELVDLTGAELREVEEAEEKVFEQQQQMAMMGQEPQVAPEQQQLMQQVQGRLQELNSING